MNVRTLSDLIEETNELVDLFLKNGNVGINPSALGLDQRAGYDLFISEENDCIGVQGEHATRSLMYYGGFEYVNEEHVTRVGDWTFFSADCDRVRTCIERFLDKQDGEETEE